MVKARLVLMIRVLKALAPAALLAVAACATPFSANVSRFSTLPVQQGQTFYVVPDDARLENSLEFGQYAGLVSERLRGFGYTPAASPTTANLVVRLAYGVDGGRERIRSTGFGGPRFGYGFGARYGFGGYGWGGYNPYFGYGRRAFVYGFNDPFLYGSFYNDVESYTVYESELTMKIERPGTRERVFEGTARARSGDRDLSTLVPNLIEAMFTGFPNNTGKTVRITIAPPERQPRR